MLFLTWRLFGSLGSLHLTDPPLPNAGKAFARADRMLDASEERSALAQVSSDRSTCSQRARTGRTRISPIRTVCVGYHAQPRTCRDAAIPPITVVMRWVKGSTARQANTLLARTGNPFWQYETYDRVIRNSDELTE